MKAVFFSTFALGTLVFAYMACTGLFPSIVTNILCGQSALCAVAAVIVPFMKID